MIKEYIKKIPTFIAFFKLFLFDVKFEILLNCIEFFPGFWYIPSTLPRPPPPLPSLTVTLIFLLVEGVEVVDNWTKFDLHGTCNSGVLIF